MELFIYLKSLLDWRREFVIVGSFVGKDKLKGKLQIVPLKFEGVWILHFEISNFRFYSLKFEVFGLYTDVS